MNPNYAEGEMLSSLQTAVSDLAQNRAAVLVMLADQPMVEPQIIDNLLEAYWRGSGDMIAPQYDGKRGNPVLIDACHFEELLSLPAGAAPRDLLKRHEVHLVPVQSPSVVQDIDHTKDYQRYRPGSI
jgi:molybdenum cofactor cytidylyltransferase